MHREGLTLPAEYNLDVAFVRGNTRLIALLLWVTHGGALACLLSIDLNSVVVFLIGIAIVAGLTYCLCYHVYRCAPQSITKMLWRNGGDWRLVTHSGDVLEADLLPTTFVHPLLVVLNFRAANPLRRVSVVLLPDAIATTQFRRLRARLRCQGVPSKDSR